MEKYTIAIHGGAGTILKTAMTPEKESAYQNALEEALHAGLNLLKDGGSSLHAVEKAVIALEDSPLFNAGKGSVYNNEGKQEMEAAIMEGQMLKAGAAVGIRNVKNPIALARCILEHSEYVMLSGKGARTFAKAQGLELKSDNWFFDQYRLDQWKEAKTLDKTQLDHTIHKEKKFGTVGAVALDIQGNVAAATSTGGLTNKKYGRIGDSSLIGAGTYANNNTCAVSCTGYGEYFMRRVAAYDVAAMMEYGKLNLEDAASQVIMGKMVDFGGEGGLIAVDRHGNIALPFNSEGMYRAWGGSEIKPVVAIYGD